MAFILIKLSKVFILIKQSKLGWSFDRILSWVQLKSFWHQFIMTIEC